MEDKRAGYLEGAVTILVICLFISFVIIGISMIDRHKAKGASAALPSKMLMDRDISSMVTGDEGWIDKGNLDVDFNGQIYLSKFTKPSLDRSFSKVIKVEKKADGFYLYIPKNFKLNYVYRGHKVPVKKIILMGFEVDHEVDYRE
jgi:hypothetical protein